METSYDHETFIHAYGMLVFVSYFIGIIICIYFGGEREMGWITGGILALLFTPPLALIYIFCTLSNKEIDRQKKILELLEKQGTGTETKKA